MGRVRDLGERSAVQGERPLAKNRKPRVAQFKNGSLIFPDGARIVVVIKDLSETGARIEFFSHTVLPQQALLVEPMLKLRREARVVWQIGGAAGLQFIEAAS